MVKRWILQVAHACNKALTLTFNESGKKIVCQRSVVLCEVLGSCCPGDWKFFGAFEVAVFTRTIAFTLRNLHGTATR